MVEGLNYDCAETRARGNGGLPGAATPVISYDGASSLQQQVASDENPSGAMPRGALRVLIADTDTATLKMVAVALRREGRDIETASDGAAAARLLCEGAFDLLLTDVRVAVEGEPLLAVAKRAAPSVTRLAMSGYATLDSALEALRAGAYAYLIKPLDIEELRLTVRQALERRELERELHERVVELEQAHTDLLRTNERLQEQVDAATASLRDKLDELEEVNTRLRDAQAQHQRFIQMVAHEMRGPLNPIINYAQIAKRPQIAPETRSGYMDTIVEHALRMNRLVDDLQTATRLSSGQFALRREPCDVGALVESLAQGFITSVSDRVFTFDGAAGSLRAVVDSDRVTQAVRNLIDNAVKYSAPGGAIEVSAWKDDQRVYIRVGDFGAGIPEAEMKRIFEPFIRLDRQASEVSGSGLGLFITRGIVEAHGGELLVQNRGAERAEGALFTLALPLEPAAVSPTEEGPEPVPARVAIGADATMKA